MKTKNCLSLILPVLFMLFVSLGQGQEIQKEFYELKTYTIKNSDQEKRMDSYLEYGYLPALKRHGITNIGVFKIREDKFLLSNKIYILIPYTSLAQFESLEAALANDQIHVTTGRDYITAKYDKPPYERINSVLMRAFPEMPKMRPTPVTGPKSDRVYELRSYESPTEATYKNKVAMFNEGGEVALFESLHAHAVFYAEVISGDRMPNLMYMTTYANMEKRDALWKAFFSSDKWQELSNDEKYKNNMNKADIMLLYPTSYSDY